MQKKHYIAKHASANKAGGASLMAGIDAVGIVLHRAGEWEWLISGGFYPPECTAADMVLLDVSTGKLTETGSLMRARAYHAGCLLPKGRVFICDTQQDNGMARDHMEEYDPFRRMDDDNGNVDQAADGSLVHPTEHGLADHRWLGCRAECELYDPEKRVIKQVARTAMRLIGVCDYTSIRLNHNIFSYRHYNMCNRTGSIDSLSADMRPTGK